MELPSRSPAAEDAWLRQAEQLDVEQLVEAVRDALGAGRPALAGRIVGLVGAGVEDPALDRARRAARLMCVNRPQIVAFPELDDLLAQARRVRVKRSKQRHRKRLRDADPHRPPRGPRRGR